MQYEESNQDKSQQERSEQESNKAASEQMNKNDSEQNKQYRENQNEITKSTDTANDADALSNNHEYGQSNDSVSIDDKNRRKLESEEDADFGNEQLQ